MVAVEVMVQSTRLALAGKLADAHDCINDIQAFEKRRHNAEKRWVSYQKQILKAYNKRVRPRTFFVGDLVLKAVGHVQKGLTAQSLL